MSFMYCPACGQKGTLQSRNDTEHECSNCQTIHWNNPKACVAVVFLDGDKALFAKRGIEPNKDKYDFPGGFLEYNEDIYDACVREIKEETTVTIRPDDLTLIAGHTLEYLPGTSVVDLIFLTTKWKGDFTAQDDVAALEWKPLTFMDNPAFVPLYEGLASKIQAVSGK